MSETAIKSGRPLVASNLSKSFSGRQVVRDVSFAVNPGEVVGLLGPNGAGKSTSFNMVAGLVKRDAGEVKLGEQSLGTLPLYKRAALGLGYLPQDATIFRGLTVLQNFQVVFEGQGLKRKMAAEKSRALIAEYHLDKVTDNLGSQLSGGERRRVEMARTLIPNPDVVLLDEPFAGVDPIAVAEIQTFISAMAARHIGVLITDHNVRETLGICDRASLISEGSIFLTGTPQEIVENPQARATYLGEDFRL